MTQKTLYLGILKTNRISPIAIFSNGIGPYNPLTVPKNDLELVNYLKKAKGYTFSFLNTSQNITLGKEQLEAKPIEKQERIQLEELLRREGITIQ